MTKFIDFLLEWNEIQFILAKISDDFLLKFWDLRGAKDCKTCRSRKMLKNAPTLAIVAVHTAENEPLKISLFHFISSIVSLNIILRARLLGFGPGGYPSHAYFSPLPKNKYIVKPHRTLIRFRASGVPIARNPHLTTIMKMRVVRWTRHLTKLDRKIGQIPAKFRQIPANFGQNLAKFRQI